MPTVPAKPEAGDTTADASPAWSPCGGPWPEYVTDAAQRTILFWDVVRRRSEEYYEHRAMAVPHVLSFDCEVILDGREMEPATNYLLVRIAPPEGVEIDHQKRPFVVVDPRAGHGPGIGGFKADSEIGVALQAGHPCYFVGFCPDPVPGQTMEDVMRAEEIFLEKVIELEPDAEGKPCVIGNCQAGWAVMMLAAVRPELFGPIIVPGAPLSFWAGVKGENPMRYLGGLLGGSWLAALSSDFGGGLFDGGYLVENFEQLNPANTYWKKSYDLWNKVDTEAERFLGFEKWWGGHVNLNAEEIQWIVDELFVGNRLATAEITTSDGRRIDLRNIRSPIVCFCSEKDNITPPPQSLGWIVDCYEEDDDVLANEQTIVYAIHPSVGHLGIFVSGGVAQKEHQEFTSNIDLIDILPPGIFEAVMIPKEEMEAGVDLATGDWVIRLEKRTLDDVRAIVQPDPEDERRFATVRRVSESNLGLYRTLLQPLVQAFANNGSTAEWMHKLQPAELPYELFSENNPLMQHVAALAEQVREQREPRAPDNPFVPYQEMLSSMMVTALDQWRDVRDRSLEQIFLTVYGNPMLQAMVGLKATDAPPRRRPGLEPEEIEHIEQRIAEIKARIAEGGAREAGIRALVYITMAGAALDERRFGALKEIRAERGKEMTLEEFKVLIREQFFALLFDPKAALDAIPQMVSDDPAGAREGLEAVRRIVTASGELEGEKAKRLEQIERLFGDAAVSKNETTTRAKTKNATTNEATKKTPARTK